MGKEVIDDGKKETEEIDYEKIVKGVTDGVQTKIDERLNSFEKNIQDNKPEPQKKEETSYFEDDSDDDEDLISKKEVKEIVTQALKSQSSEFRKVALSVQSEQNAQNAKDVQANRDFPMLDAASNQYDQEFYDLVSTEVGRREKEGRSDTYLIYDCAAAIKATSTKWDKTNKQKATEEQRILNNEQAVFSVKGVQTTVSGPTDAQYALGKSMGLSTDSLKKHFKRGA